MPTKTTDVLERFAFSKTKKFSLIHLYHNISGMKKNNGVSLVQASYVDDLFEIIKKISDLTFKSSHIDYLDDRFASIKEDLRLYIKQQIALDIYEDLLMANVSHWFATQEESELYGKNPVLLFQKKNYWSYLVMDHMKNRNIDYTVIQHMNLKRNNGIRFTYFLLKLLIELVRSLVKYGSPSRRSAITKIGVPFYVLQNFTDFIDLRNYYLFWFPNSGIPPENVLIYLDEPKFALSAEEVNKIREAGFGLVFCPHRIFAKVEYGVPVHICSFKTTLSLTIRYLKLITKMYSHAKDRVTKGQWKILSLLFIQLPYWEDFFQSNNIKVKFRFHDIFGVRDIAAKLSGAVTMSYHYSNHSRTTIMHQEICDVFFIWGDKYEKFLLPEHSTTKNIIRTGYVFDYTFEALKHKAATMRKDFKSNTISYVIGIFDENLRGNPGKAMIDCYTAVLTYAINNQHIGILIKPKKATFYDDLKISPDLVAVALVNILDNEGRLMILDYRKYPVEAGYISDIVIGLVANSTAALECALAGIPAIVYDCSSSKQECTYYEWGCNKVIFDDTQYLIKAIDEDVKKMQRNNGFADWSSSLNSIDPFRDGKANIRIGFYIKTLICKLDDGLTKDEAIKTTNKAYANKFGWDKVTSLH